jgi:hypothetical protein
VRAEEPKIDAIELLTVDLGVDSKLEHTVEIDGWVIGVGFLSDDTGPHCIVELRFTGHG